MICTKKARIFRQRKYLDRRDYIMNYANKLRNDKRLDGLNKKRMNEKLDELEKLTFLSMNTKENRNLILDELECKTYSSILNQDIDRYQPSSSEIRRFMGITYGIYKSIEADYLSEGKLNPNRILKVGHQLCYAFSMRLNHSFMLYLYGSECRNFSHSDFITRITSDFEKNYGHIEGTQEIITQLRQITSMIKMVEKLCMTKKNIEKYTKPLIRVKHYSDQSSDNEDNEDHSV